MSRTIALTLGYNGGGFSGFARQPGQRTVQGDVESALKTLFRREVETVGAGRTDTGVHALGQVMSFRLDDEELTARSFERLRLSLNALTDDGITIHKVEAKPDDFSARFSAVHREYRFRFVFDEVEPLFLRPYVWWISTKQPPDIQAMKQAGAFLVGEHDFKSFCVTASALDKNTVRELYTVNLFGAEHLGEECVVMQIIGNAFLHSMIRVIAGTMADIALRKKPPEWMAQVLAARDRRAAGP
ncbi:MAG TPA: tRNA pseudouridine(38-40) synthase TruA, partial [Coriobacteriia bacterium]|nr:tRNA pseudouridine(38-40) synthase TruA [Coriobacteriia bacterium]